MVASDGVYDATDPTMTAVTPSAQGPPIPYGCDQRPCRGNPTDTAREVAQAAFVACMTSPIDRHPKNLGQLARWRNVTFR